MFRKMTALVLAILCLFGLTSCSAAANPVGENTIRNDILCQDDTIYGGEMSLVSMSIVKRQTNESQKTDYVWADFVAENDECRYIASCMLSYGLYNDGWHLDSYQVLSQSIETIGGLPADVALARANQLMDQYYAMFSSRNKGVVELIGMNTQGPVTSCLFDHAEAMGPSGLLTLHWRFRVSFRMTEDGWSTGAWDGTMNEYAYDWNLVGQWKGQNDGENFSLTVHSYDPEEKTVDVEYAFGSRRSNGVETLYIVNQDFWDQEQKEWSLNEDETAHHGFIDLYPFGAEYTDAGEGYGILAESDNTHCWLEKVQ